MVVLAGCGTQAATKPTAVSSALTPAATPGVTATLKVPPTPVVTGRVAAIINGHSVPVSDFRMLLSLSQRSTQSQFGKPSPMATLTAQAMNEVVINELVREYAAQHNVRVTSVELDRQQQTDIASAGTRQAFDKSLAQAGIDLAQYRQLVAENLLGFKVEQIIAPLKTKKQLVARVRHILIELKPLASPPTAPNKPGGETRTDAQAHVLAESLLKQLEKGANFATLARLHSDDVKSGQQGGDLGAVLPNQMVPSFNHAAFTQPLRVPRIVRSQYGYHIIEVMTRGLVPGQPSAQQQTLQRTAFLQWVAAQKKHSRITQVARVTG
jgi:parvulin-like peptidyl-prolyl isomerase